jgi:segregation and condensation protein A
MFADNSSSMSPADTFEIHLPQFEGPFDLLLFFIERDELDIHAISIASIADDFLDYIHRMNTLNIELAGEFIVVAATLMRIKAKLLLPRHTADDTAEQDQQEDLVARLIEYKQFKELSAGLQQLEEERFLKEKRGSITADLELAGQAAEPGEELSSFDLYRLMLVYERLLNRNRSREERVTHTVVQYPYTIEQQKTVIAELLTINKKLDFSVLKQTSENKVHFVYNFLALLEMLQQKLAMIQTGLGYNNFWVTKIDR